MIMGHFGMLRLYLRGFYETILAYASVKLLPVGQRKFFVAKRRYLLELSFNFLQENLLTQGEHC